MTGLMQTSTAVAAPAAIASDLTSRYDLIALSSPGGDAGAGTLSPGDLAAAQALPQRTPLEEGDYHRRAVRPFDLPEEIVAGVAGELSERGATALADTVVGGTPLLGVAHDVIIRGDHYQLTTTTFLLDAGLATDALMGTDLLSAVAPAEAVVATSWRPLPVVEEFSGRSAAAGGDDCPSDNDSQNCFYAATVIGGAYDEDNPACGVASALFGAVIGLWTSAFTGNPVAGTTVGVLAGQAFKNFVADNSDFCGSEAFDEAAASEFYAKCMDAHRQACAAPSDPPPSDPQDCDSYENPNHKKLCECCIDPSFVASSETRSGSSSTSEVGTADVIDCGVQPGPGGNFELRGIEAVHQIAAYGYCDGALFTMAFESGQFAPETTLCISSCYEESPTNWNSTAATACADVVTAEVAAQPSTIATKVWTPASGEYAMATHDDCVAAGLSLFGLI